MEFFNTTQNILYTMIGIYVLIQQYRMLNGVSGISGKRQPGCGRRRAIIIYSGPEIYKRRFAVFPGQGVRQNLHRSEVSPIKMSEGLPGDVIFTTHFAVLLAPVLTSITNL